MPFVEFKLTCFLRAFFMEHPEYEIPKNDRRAREAAVDFNVATWAERHPELVEKHTPMRRKRDGTWDQDTDKLLRQAADR